MTAPRQFAARLLRNSSRAYAAAAVEQLGRKHADLVQHGLPAGFADPLDDTQVRILHLAESVAVDRPALLEHAVAWYKVVLHHRGVSPDYLPANLDAIAAALQRELPADAAAIAVRHVLAARERVRAAPIEVAPLLSRTAPHGELAARFLLAVLEGRADDAVDLVRSAVRAGVSVADVHDHVLTPAQREAGRMWSMGEITIADEHYGSAVVDRVLWLLQEQLPRPAADAPRVLTFGVGGNLHELGLRLVAQRLQLAGFAVHHLGANMPAVEFDLVLAQQRTDLIAIAATLTLHLHAAAQAIAQLRALPAARDLPIVLGGEPFRVVPDLHAVLGADGSAADAAAAVDVARRLVAPRQ
ncbi:MAG: cobalamin-dependent protein [Planctomycetes bacterium]|nr:cobalamin-dependent protein [Planctomycetota bacterium]